MICDTCIYKSTCKMKPDRISECQEAQEEARREAMKLDDNEDSWKWRFNH